MQMMFEVPHIVYCEKFEGHCIALADPAKIFSRGFRNFFHQMKKMAVIDGPELDEIAPGAGFIVLNRNPVLLGVGRHAKLALDLGANEAMMIIGGRIKQMAEDLFAGPVFRGCRGAGVGVGNAGKFGGYASENPPKFFDGGFKRLHNQLYRSWGGPPSTYRKLAGKCE